MNDLHGLLPDEIDSLVNAAGAPRYRADQLLTGLYRSFVPLGGANEHADNRY